MNLIPFFNYPSQNNPLFKVVLDDVYSMILLPLLINY